MYNGSLQEVNNPWHPSGASWNMMQQQHATVTWTLICFVVVPMCKLSANRLFGPNSKQRDFKGVALGLHRHTGFEDEVHIIMRT